MLRKVILSYFFYFTSMLLMAEPSVLTIDKSVKPKSFDYKINAVHKRFQFLQTALPVSNLQ